MKKKLNWLILICGPILVFSIPTFDPTALLKETLIPSDVAPGTIIYRLRASDPTFDYPLTYTLRNETTIVAIETLNCTRLNSICQANVILRKRLVPNRFYDFIVDVQSRRGEAATLNCSFKSTDAITPISSIFPGAPTLLMVSESTKRNTELGTIIARGNRQRPNGVLLELWGASKFGLHQHLINDRDVEGTLLLLGLLDYEVQTVHHVTVLANDPFTEMSSDTRNIAGWPLLISVLDEQDTPPIFTLAPPTTTLSPTLDIGDIILLVHAEDGDRGNPRKIRYELLNNNTFAPFFNISETGELGLIRPLEQVLAQAGNQPILLTVVAEEIRLNPLGSPAQSSTAQIALLPPDHRDTSLPNFGANEYNAILDENAAPGTVLHLHQAEIVTSPGNVVVLELLNDNNTFEISPKATNTPTSFQVKVNNPTDLDYEKWHQVSCYITAKEVGATNYSAIVPLNVLLNDVNDNDPLFRHEEYQASISETASFGTSVIKIEAFDIDREPSNKIKYMGLEGPGSNFFDIHEESGVITVKDEHSLDAESSPTLSFLARVADENGKGRTAAVPVLVTLIDVNDEKPIFEKSVYEFILNADRNGFTSKAVVKAIDGDLSAPNNEVQYELINPLDGLGLNGKSGELFVRGVWAENGIVMTTVRAYDGGIPRLSSTCEVRIYPPEAQSRRSAFIVPGRNPNLENIRRTIMALTGGNVVIEEVRPAEGYEPGGVDFSGTGDDLSGSSVIIALITYPKNSSVDLKRIQQILRQNADQNLITKSEPPPSESRISSILLWLLLLLILILLIIAIVLTLCCICAGCPLYVPPKRRKLHPEIQEKLIQTHEAPANKSVQAAEWFGRKEAWSPAHTHLENEVESLQIERGSDRHRKPQPVLEPRDQYYIREGNTDILRLITRGSDGQRPVTLMAADSGKDILLRRYIEQQQMQQAPPEAYKSYGNLPNAVNRPHLDHETLLETSLLQQNLLLRHILMERERDRDLRLETQSLPAGTQTDQRFERLGHTKKRKTRSDNDASETDDEEGQRAETRRRNYRRRRVRKIKTPIQEEESLESSVGGTPVKQQQRPKDGVVIKQTRTSELRKMRASAQGSAKYKNIETQVLREISASLERNEDDGKKSDRSSKLKKYFSEDSLDDSPRTVEEKSMESDKKIEKYRSESDLVHLVKIEAAKSKPTSRKGSIKGRGDRKTVPRYMEWYNKNQKQGDEETAKKSNNIPKKTTKKDRSKSQEKGVSNKKGNIEVKSNDVSQEIVSKSKTVESREGGDLVENGFAGGGVSEGVIKGPKHPLLQHSERRFESQYKVRKLEDDADSGIAVNKLPIAQKKSVFTIAYDDMHTNQLNESAGSPI